VPPLVPRVLLPPKCRVAAPSGKNDFTRTGHTACRALPLRRVKATPYGGAAERRALPRHEFLASEDKPTGLFGDEAEDADVANGCEAS
jgi:hypothetical protein